MVPEWIELPDGTRLHWTTVHGRQVELGWSEAEASSTPVRPVSGKHGKENVAARARADGITPGKVQVLMREYGATYEQAVAYIRSDRPQVPETPEDQ